MNLNYKSEWFKTLKSHRIKMNFTQQKISEICNTYKSRWSLYESGDAFPNEIEWQKIYYHLKTTPFDFFNFEEFNHDEKRLLELTHKLLHKYRDNKSESLLNKYIKFSIIELEHLFEKNNKDDNDWIA